MAAMEGSGKQPQGLPDLQGSPKMTCRLMPRMPLSGPMRRRPDAVAVAIEELHSLPCSPAAALQRSFSSSPGGLGPPLPRCSSGAPSPSMSLRQPSKRSNPEPLEPLVSSSKSAPSVGSSSLSRGCTVPEGEWHRMHIATSPQGLFARTVPPKRFGSKTSQRFHQLGMQEHRPGAQRFSESRRPSTGPASCNAPVLDAELSGSLPRKSSRETMQRTTRMSLEAARRCSHFVGEQRLTRVARDASTYREYQNSKDCFDLREGLRVAILNTKPAPLGADKVWPPPPDERKPATREETLRLYKTYVELIRTQEGGVEEAEDEYMITLEGGGGSDGICSTLEISSHGHLHVGSAEFGPLANWNTRHPDDPSYLVRARDCVVEVNGIRANGNRLMDMCCCDQLLHIVLERPRTLAIISAASFNAWAWMKIFMASNVREKAVFTAMFKAYKAYLKYQTRSKHRQSGLTLTALMRWCWPFLRPVEIMQMYIWICVYELSSIRIKTPRLISKDARKQIEGIFREMDWRGKGYCTPADFSGGENQDIAAKLKNCVDEATVQKVLGEGNITLPRFLELMCEDDFRGHENAATAILKDGRYIVEQVRESISFRGWVLRDVPKHEEPTRRRIDALEAEVLHWRDVSRGRARERERDIGPSALSLSLQSPGYFG